MKLPALLLAAVLATLALALNPAASRQDQGAGIYARPTRPDSPQWGAAGGYGSPNGDPDYPSGRGGGGRYASPPPTSGRLPLAPPAEYRFRGGEILRPDGEGFISSEATYRFRPLTEQERERVQSDSGWRPPNLDRPSGQGEGLGVTPADEAYGDRSDDWFRRYYGDRP